MGIKGDLKQKVILEGVKVVPGLMHNLVSLGMVTDRGFSLKGNSWRLILEKGASKIVFDKIEGSRSLFGERIVPQVIMDGLTEKAYLILSKGVSIDINESHKKFGHMNKGDLRHTS